MRVPPIWFKVLIAMNTTNRRRTIKDPPALPLAFAVLCVAVLSSPAAHASVAYGSINNFDTVNDTSNVCHGFEIELDDLHSTDITYTYDYNHYGTPKITEFSMSDSAGLPTNVLVRYAALWQETSAS